MLLSSTTNQTPLSRPDEGERRANASDEGRLPQGRRHLARHPPPFTSTRNGLTACLAERLYPCRCHAPAGRCLCARAKGALASAHAPESGLPPMGDITAAFREQAAATCVQSHNLPGGGRALPSLRLRECARDGRPTPLPSHFVTGR